MDEYIKNYTDEKKLTSGYTKSSIKSNLRRVEKVIDKKFEDWKASDFKDSEKILDDIIDSYSLNSAIVSISVIKSWLMFHKESQKLIDDYGDLVKELTKEKDNIVDKQQKSLAEEDLGEDFDYQTLKDKSKRFIEANMKDLKDRSKLKNLLILGLFSLQPPTRIGNYLNMEYRKGQGSKLSEDKNYLLENGGKFKFVFNKYKTAKYLGKIDLPVEDKLLEELLRKYTDKMKQKDIVFGTSSSTISNALKSTTKRYLKAPITLNPFRHSYLTYFLKGNPSIEEKVKIARLIGQKYNPPRAEKYARIT